MRASVIVPTANRDKSLQQCLRSLVDQSFSSDDYEIIVVDNASTDNTKNVIEECIGLFDKHHIRYVFEPEPGLLSGRHRGALEATSELLIFVDDDIEASHGWLSAIVDVFDDQTVQLVGGRNLPQYEGAPPAWLQGFWTATPYGGSSCGWLSLMDLGEKRIDIDPNYIWGLNFSIRKKALFDLGGFHPDVLPKHLQHLLGDGETGLTLKAREKGYRAVYQPQALVYHRIPKGRLTTEYFEQRSYLQGIFDSYTEVRRQNGCLKRYRLDVRGTVRFLGMWCKNAFCEPAEDPELKRIKRRVQVARKAGFDFHQKALREKVYLLEWVLRQDYWDYKLPD